MSRRVAFFIDSQTVGGAELAMFTLIDALDKDQWEPFVLVPSSAETNPVITIAHNRQVPVLAVPLRPNDPIRSAGLPAAARTIRRLRPAVFHAHLPAPLRARHALTAAAAARVPAVVATVHVIPPGAWLGPIAAMQLRLQAVGVDRYLAVSRDIATFLTETLRYPRSKVDVVYNGVDSERFMSAPTGLRAELGVGRNTLAVTCARLTEQKGIDVLLRAAARVPGVSFAIAGDGPLMDSLASLATELSVADRVFFLGQRSDIPALLAAADVVLLPSRYEGTSLAILEAMAAGRPIISSAIPGTRELVTNGETGLLVPPSDHGALAEALTRLVGDEALRARLGAAARSRAEDSFSTRAMGSRVNEIYLELLGTQSRRRSTTTGDRG